jgi:hypothetical protein
LFSTIGWSPEPQPEPKARPATNDAKTLPNERRDIE